MQTFGYHIAAFRKEEPEKQSDKEKQGSNRITFFYSVHCLLFVLVNLINCLQKKGKMNR